MKTRTTAKEIKLNDDYGILRLYFDSTDNTINFEDYLSFPATDWSYIRAAIDEMSAHVLAETGKPSFTNNIVTGSISDLEPLKQFNPRFRFTDNGDSTVTDNTTGLMWMQKTAVIRMNWSEAMDWCEELTLAGYDDWRLPTIDELKSIVVTMGNPTIDPTFFPGTVPSGYWTSNTDADYPDGAWRVSFNCGLDHNYYKSAAYYVRAVRGGRRLTMKPICVENFADDGAHSHWSVIDHDSGEIIIEDINGIVTDNKIVK